MSTSTIKVLGYGGSLLLILIAFTSVSVFSFGFTDVANSDTQIQNQPNVGPPGPQGPTGPSGQNGIDGKDGVDGATGATGQRGSTGPQGDPGATGATGSQGTSGPEGRTGARGSAGPQGRIGPTGPAGATGATGPQGIQGPPGPIGPEGPAGITVISGIVNANGTIAVGSGFTVVIVSSGRYRITFASPFPSIPVITVTTVFGSIGVDAGTAVQPRENAVIDQQDQNSVLIATANSAGALTPQTFEFFALTAP
jgi:hypothetical protein